MTRSSRRWHCVAVLTLSRQPRTRLNHRCYQVATPAMHDDWRAFYYTYTLAAAFEMYSQGGLQGCLSSPEVVGNRDPGQAAPFLMRDSLADKGRCDRPLACSSGCWVCWRRSGARGGTPHMRPVEPVGRQERGLRVVVMMLTTRVLQTSKSLLRVVVVTSCDLRTWGWRASGSFCGRSSE
jgi:hypothetical protein